MVHDSRPLVLRCRLEQQHISDRGHRRRQDHFRRYRRSQLQDSCLRLVQPRFGSTLATPERLASKLEPLRGLRLRHLPQSGCQSTTCAGGAAGLRCHGRLVCAEAVSATMDSPVASLAPLCMWCTQMVHCSRPLVLRCGPQQPCTSLAFTRSSRPLATSSAPPCMRRTRWCMQLVRSSRPLVLRCCLEQQRTSTEATDAGTTTIFVGVGARSGGIRSWGWFSRMSSPPWQ